MDDLNIGKEKFASMRNDGPMEASDDSGGWIIQNQNWNFIEHEL